MRTAAVVVLSLVAALAAAAVVPHKEADKDLLVKQQKLVALLYHVQQPTIIPEEKEIAKTYKPIDHLDNYKYKDQVEVFWKYYTEVGFLPRGKAFSIFYEQHLQQAKALFELLYYAKDFESFLKTAVWAREYLNEGMFVNAFTVAVVHREDTKDVTLPAPYEVFPQLFVNAEVIQKAYNVLLQGHESTKEAPYIIQANYSGFPEANNPEELVSYFTEDVGLNSFFAYLHYRYPFWLSAKNYSLPEFQQRGERYAFFLQQLLAHYYLERLSNNLPDVKSIDYNEPVPVGYYPELRLTNGLEAPARPKGIYPNSIDILHLNEIKAYERRIRDSIDAGYLEGHDYKKYNLLENDETDLLGNVIEGNADSINEPFYGSVYRNLLSLFGHIVDPDHQYGVPPSVLEEPQTILRDPLFYRIAKHVFSIFFQYKNRLNPYGHQDLFFPGISIEDVTVDKLVTYFDNFDFEINNALDLSSPEEGKKYNFVARQQRLNHKPFNYYIKVKSEKEVESVVRVYIAPKYDVYGRELSLNERTQYVVLLDIFNQKLSAGENEIKRNSKESPLFAKEAPHYSDLNAVAEAAIKGEKQFFLDEFRSHFGFPERLALPRGSRGGLPLIFYVVITPADVNAKHSLLPYGDNQPAGFPFDKPIKEIDFDVPNVQSEDVYVVHRRLEDINTTA